MYNFNDFFIIVGHVNHLKENGRFSFFINLKLIDLHGNTKKGLIPAKSSECFNADTNF